MPSHPDFRVVSLVARHAPRYGHLFLSEAGSCGPESPFQAREASCEVNLAGIVLSHVTVCIGSLFFNQVRFVSSLQLGMSVIKGVEGIILSRLSQTVKHDMANRLPV